MNRPWQFVLHQSALEYMDTLRPAERRKVREAMLQLVAQPWQRPAAELRSPNNRTYYIKKLAGFQIVYWLDAYVNEVFIVRVERI
jgi:mRNA-degrading endonuclease RelE of RelBE toxin-antitoxin system